MKTRLKLFITLALCLMLCLAFISCNVGNDGNNPDGDNGDNPTTETPNFQYSEGLEFSLNSDNISYSVSDIVNCTDTDIVIPSCYNDLPVMSIGNYAFQYCDNLTSITIPDSVTSIGDRAFYGCTSLASITIPDSVTDIGCDAFQYCSSLTSVIIPDSVTYIG